MLSAYHVKMAMLPQQQEILLVILDVLYWPTITIDCNLIVNHGQMYTHVLYMYKSNYSNITYICYLHLSDS